MPAPSQMEGVADIAEAYSQGEVRVSHEQNLVFPHVAIESLPAVYRALERLGFAEANIGKITDIIACPGLDYCALANARSIPVAQSISTHFADRWRASTISATSRSRSRAASTPAAITTSATSASSASIRTASSSTRSASAATSTSARRALGTILGPAVEADKVVEAVDALVATYLEARTDGERFVDTYRRIGAQPFKESVYGNR